jgi:hypothetical protein
MIMQKIHVFIVGIIVFVTSCKAVGQINQNGLELEGRQIGTYFQAPCDSSYIILIEVKLRNNSVSPKEFVAYNCLTAFNFLTDNEEVSIIGSPCSDNAPVLFRILKGEELSIPLILHLKQNSIMNINSIKIGFVFLSQEEFNWDTFRDTIIERKKTQRNILWSTPISAQIVFHRQWAITDIK